MKALILFTIKTIGEFFHLYQNEASREKEEDKHRHGVPYYISTHGATNGQNWMLISKAPHST